MVNYYQLRVSGRDVLFFPNQDKQTTVSDLSDGIAGLSTKLEEVQNEIVLFYVLIIHISVSTTSPTFTHLFFKNIIPWRSSLAIRC